MHLLRGPVRLALLALAAFVVAVAVPAASVAQDRQPQCADGIDNDADGAVDGADAGCGGGADDDEADSIYAGIVTVTVPLPVVTLQGTVTRGGVVDVSKLLIRAQRGSVVSVRCAGRHCPTETLRRTMLSTSLRLTKFERKLRPAMTVKVRVARSGQVGKYVRYKVRRGGAPVRYDACLDQTTGDVRGCFLD